MWESEFNSNTNTVIQIQQETAVCLEKSDVSFNESLALKSHVTKT